MHRTGLNSSNNQTGASKCFLLHIFQTYQEPQYEVVESVGGEGRRGKGESGGWGWGGGVLED